MRTLLFVALLLAAAGPASAQSAAGPVNAERIAFGLWAGPALDGDSPWLLTGIRISYPLTSRLSADVETATIQGGQGERTRINGWLGGRLRVLRTPGEAHSRYWIVGFALMPGDELNPDGTIRSKPLFSVATFGIGARQLLARYLRVSTDLVGHAGDGFGVTATVGVQFGAPHRGTARRTVK